MWQEYWGIQTKTIGPQRVQSTYVFRGLKEREISRLFVYFSSFEIYLFWGGGTTGDRIREKGSGIGAGTNNP